MASAYVIGQFLIRCDEAQFGIVEQDGTVVDAIRTPTTLRKWDYLADVVRVRESERAGVSLPGDLHTTANSTMEPPPQTFSSMRLTHLRIVLEDGLHPDTKLLSITNTDGTDTRATHAVGPQEQTFWRDIFLIWGMETVLESFAPRCLCNVPEPWIQAWRAADAARIATSDSDPAPNSAISYDPADIEFVETAFQCQDDTCKALSEAVCEEALYECDCGNVFAAEGRKSKATCPECAKKAAKAADRCCAECQADHVEQIAAYRCPCGQLHQTREEAQGCTHSD